MRIIAFISMLVFGFIHTSSRAEGASQSTMNAKIGVIPFLIGGGQFEFDLKVSEGWAMGPTLTGLKTQTTDPNFYGPLSLEITIVGIRGTFFLNGTFESGFYFSPTIQSASLKATGVSILGRNIQASASGLALQAILGHHWFGDHFNFGIGVGGAKSEITSIEVNDGVSKWTQSVAPAGITFAAEALLGFSF